MKQFEENKEMQYLKKNHMQDLLKLSKDKKAIIVNECLKLNEKGTFGTYKARLVKKGFNQKFEINYNQTFSTIVKHTTEHF